MHKQRIIIGISGSSGIIYGIRLLEELKNLQVETHLVVTKAAQLTRAYETEISAKDLESLATVSYNYKDITAPIASGSYKTSGMIIAPCSMKTLGEIANSITSNLLTRAADVILKERRRLVLMPRETPLNLAHLRNMTSVTEMGGIICPPTPAFYQKPKTILELVNDTIGRVLDLFNLENKLVQRWGENDTEIK